MKLDALNKYGIHFAQGAELISDQNMHLLAMDAATPLITAANNGIPAMLTTYVDPAVIEILTAPLNATKIYGEVQKGDFATDTATFLSVEFQGVTDAYGDFSQTGEAGHNANFPQRQAYGFQTMTTWGDRQMEIAGKARLNYASNQQKASAMAIMRKTNLIYLLGVSGLQNYGLMNDPLLSAPSTPTGVWSGLTADQIYDDVLVKLWYPLLAQGKGLIKRDSKLQLVMSPEIEGYLLKTTAYNVQVIEKLQKGFPNLEIVVVPEFATGSGQLVQMIAHDIDGTPTGQCAFAERLRSHGVIRNSSSFTEKKSSRAWGTVLYRPFCVSQCLGV